MGSVGFPGDKMYTCHMDSRPVQEVSSSLGRYGGNVYR